MTAIAAPLSCAICVALFFLPGVAASLAFKTIPAAHRLTASIVLSCLLGYLTFWIYLFSPVIGKAFTLLVLSVSIGVICIAIRSRQKIIFSAGIVTQLALCVMVVMLYASLMNLSSFDEDQPTLASSYFFKQTQDNLFPLIFAHRLFNGEDTEIILGWRSSERPPLQAGILLLTGIPFLKSSIWYQAMGTAIQSSWVIAMFCLANSLNISTQIMKRTLLLAVFSGFFFLHTVFVWPKLIAATLIIIGTAMIWEARFDEANGKLSLLMGTAAWGCAWMAHGSAGFALPLAVISVGAAIIRNIHLPVKQHAKLLTLMAAISFLLIFPWNAYKYSYGETSDTLIKYHLGRVFYTGDDLSTLQVLRDAYTSRTASELLERKFNNIRTLFTSYIPYESSATGWRRADYYHLFHTLGALNAGWLAWLYCSIRRHRSASLLPMHSDALLKQAGITISAASVVILFWVLAEFGPTTAEIVNWIQKDFGPPISVTILHQGSFAPVILLFFGLGVAVQSYSRLLWWLLVTINFALFTYSYVITPNLLSSLNYTPAFTAIVSATGMLFLTLVDKDIKWERQ